MVHDLVQPANELLYAALLGPSVVGLLPIRQTCGVVVRQRLLKQVPEILDGHFLLLQLLQLLEQPNPVLPLVILLSELIQE